MGLLFSLSLEIEGMVTCRTEPLVVDSVLSLCFSMCSSTGGAGTGGDTGPDDK